MLINLSPSLPKNVWAAFPSKQYYGEGEREGGKEGERERKPEETLI